MTSPIAPDDRLRAFLDQRERARMRVRTIWLSVVAIVLFVVVGGGMLFGRHMSAASRLKSRGIEVDLYIPEERIHRGPASTVSWHPQVWPNYINTVRNEPLAPDDFLLFKELFRVQVLDLTGCSDLGDNLLAPIEALTSLEELRLEETESPGRRQTRGRLTDKTLARVGRLKNLRVLSMAGQNVGDDGLKHLVGLDHLTDLDLDRTAVTDAGLKHLASMPSLNYIRLAKTNVTDEGIMELQKALPNATVLRVSE